MYHITILISMWGAKVEMEMEIQIPYSSQPTVVDESEVRRDGDSLVSNERAKK
jgi:hypothetical protein